MIVLVHHVAYGPSIYVGPFVDLEDAQAWAVATSEHRAGPAISWGVVRLQDPDDPRTPRWY